jgi:hypothetical protein
LPEAEQERECVYYVDFDEYECICEGNKCTDFVSFAIESGFIPNEQGLCAVEGYKLDGLHAWWWLCVPDN